MTAIHRRKFLLSTGMATTGVAASVACGPDLLAQAAEPAPQPSSDDLLCRWSLRVVRRMQVTSGPPRHRAFPAIVKLQNGDLLVAYREGTDHWYVKDGIVRTVSSSDNGKTWSEPQTVWEVPEHNLGTHNGMKQLADGALLLPGVDVLDIRTANWLMKPYLMRSEDNGHTWSKPEEPKPEGLPQFQWFSTYGPIFELEDGTVVWSVGARKKGIDLAKLTTALLISRDGGRTWPEYREVNTGLDDEKAVLALPSGRWLAVIRNQPGITAPYYFQQTYSHDHGVTWSPLKQINVQGQAPVLHRTPSGVLVLTYRALKFHPERDVKTQHVILGLGIATSFDEGDTWHEGSLLYRSPNHESDTSYSSIAQINDKEFLCVYYTASIEKTPKCEIEGVLITESV